jgi:hypothetical protein
MSTPSTELQSRQDWRIGSSGQRMLAASLTLLLTFMLLKVLSYIPSEQTRRINPDNVRQFLNLRFIELMPPQGVAQKPDPDEKPVLSVQKSASQNLPQKQTIAPATLTASQTVISEPSQLPADPLSTPLQIDSRAVRRAYQDSKSEIELQAERSGRVLNDKPKTKFDRLETAVAQAAKADCLGKDSGGAGLLAIPVALYLFAADKCK